MGAGAEPAVLDLYSRFLQPALGDHPAVWALSLAFVVALVCALAAAAIGIFVLLVGAGAHVSPEAKKMYSEPAPTADAATPAEQQQPQQGPKKTLRVSSKKGD